jgi:hypothetical protein
MELDQPHYGHVIIDVFWDCVTEWKIENKVISITLDNASNNVVATKDLKAEFILGNANNLKRLTSMFVVANTSSTWWFKMEQQV